MSEEKKKLTPSNAVVKIATEIVRQQIVKQPMAEKSLVPVPIDPIDCELLKELLDATNELYYTRCIL